MCVRKYVHMFVYFLLHWMHGLTKLKDRDEWLNLRDIA